jgi:hypothetical protein
VEIQSRFAAAVLDPAAALPETIANRGGCSVERRFAVHRNNVASALVAVLAARYPLVRRLVGERFFGEMARLYASREPPCSPVLLLYGKSFPAFLETFAPAAAIDYLADVARLEFARGLAYHAADHPPLGSAAFASLDPARIGDARLALHPSVSLLWSRFPVVSIFEAHQRDEVGPIADWSSEAALVARPALDVEMWRLPPGGFSFLSRLADGATLASAVEAGFFAAADFDPTASLALLISARVVVDMSSS